MADSNGMMKLHLKIINKQVIKCSNDSSCETKNTATKQNSRITPPNYLCKSLSLISNSEKTELNDIERIKQRNSNENPYEYISIIKI